MKYSSEFSSGMNHSDHRLGFILVTSAALAWSLGGVFTRWIPLDGLTMVAWRGLFGAAGLAAIICTPPQRHTWRSLATMGWRGWLFVVQGSVGMICYITALRHTTVAAVAVIYATAPFLAATLGWFLLREKPRRSALLASGAALIGVAVMVGFGGGGGLAGDLLAFGMTISMAVATVAARSFRDIPVLPTACLSSLLSALVCWPFGSPLSVGAHDVALLGLFGLVNFALGLPLFVLGAKRLPAIETALIGSMEAPLAPLWVWLAFGENPGRSTLLGGAIVFAAVAAHLAASRPRQQTSFNGTSSRIS